jgi:hypothetical protein
MHPTRSKRSSRSTASLRSNRLKELTPELRVSGFSSFAEASQFQPRWKIHADEKVHLPINLTFRNSFLTGWLNLHVFAILDMWGRISSELSAVR